MVVDVQITHITSEKPYITKEELDEMLKEYGQTKFRETRKINEKYHKQILKKIYANTPNFNYAQNETGERKITYSEGKEKQRKSKYRERDRQATEEAKRIHGTKCQVCGFDFEETYGDLGKGYIVVHHLKPIHEGERDTDPKTDLACVCANCHAMLDKSNMSIEEMKILIKK